VNDRINYGAKIWLQEGVISRTCPSCVHTNLHTSDQCSSANQQHQTQSRLLVQLLPVLKLGASTPTLEASSASLALLCWQRPTDLCYLPPEMKASTRQLGSNSHVTEQFTEQEVQAQKLLHESTVNSACNRGKELDLSKNSDLRSSKS
jgi:hypothetical protein